MKSTLFQMVKPKENPTKTKTPSLLVYIHPNIFIHSVCHSFVLFEVRATALPFSRAINENAWPSMDFFLSQDFGKTAVFDFLLLKYLNYKVLGKSIWRMRLWYDLFRMLLLRPSPFVSDSQCLVPLFCSCMEKRRFVCFYLFLLASPFNWSFPWNSVRFRYSNFKDFKKKNFDVKNGGK